MTGDRPGDERQGELRGADGLLPSTHAIYRGEPDVARELLPPDDVLTTAEAALFVRLERLRALLDEDPKRVNEWTPDGFTPLHLALFGGDPAVVTELIDRGADLEARSSASFARDVRPIHTAVFVGDPALVELIASAGADVNSREAGGSTALHAAAQNGNVAAAGVLLAHGADRTITDDRGRTAADVASTAGHEDVAALIAP